MLCPRPGEARPEDGVRRRCAHPGAPDQEVEDIVVYLSSLGKPALAWFPFPSPPSQQVRQPHDTLLTLYAWLLSEFITALMLHFFVCFC